MELHNGFKYHGRYILVLGHTRTLPIGFSGNATNASCVLEHAGNGCYTIGISTPPISILMRHHVAVSPARLSFGSGLLVISPEIANFQRRSWKGSPGPVHSLGFQSCYHYTSSTSSTSQNSSPDSYSRLPICVLGTHMQWRCVHCASGSSCFRLPIPLLMVVHSKMNRIPLALAFCSPFPDIFPAL